MEFPEDLRYSKEHEWVRLNGSEALIGISAFAQSELGDIVFVDIDCEGDTIEKDEIFGAVEAVKTVSDLYMPVTGEVLEINPALNDKPDLVNNDPYNEGWMIRIKVTDASELDSLMDAAAYRAMVGK
jgi:glycine cleavage system H protein